ncbi:MAG: glycogen debranching protein GlgX, partial [Actinomycetota bacterium]|nr:glycogen debranching protein GlgX [Actinomycetota bacterium]
MELWPGYQYPLGASWDGRGTNFSVFSEHSEGVELCLFDPAGTEERLDLTEVTASVWHGYVAGVGPGQHYGFRVRGTFSPRDGLRFDPSKILIDPYAKSIDGDINCTRDVFSYDPGDPAEDLKLAASSTSTVPRAVVIDESFDWRGDVSVATPWHETIIYETHVRGLTMLHPEVPARLRGTYAALAEPAVVDHLRSMCITAIELLPIHHFVRPKHLLDHGLKNYWGYDSIGYFAPHAAYSSSGSAGGQVTEFKQMVKAMHQAGIEVILDVVYNHTGEGNHLGPTLSFRGIDNSVYYRLVEDDPRLYMDFTGTGNTLNARHPQVLKLIMDSLRYWVMEMHVDGFRFDLTSALARELYGVDQLSSFLDVIHQDPVLSTVKLIAEPWDLGEGGYQAGNFPGIWSEWNGKYRDCIRDYCRGHGPSLAEFALRFTGSSDLYQPNGRRPYASINYITAHDGFTLHDLVSYNEKHNEANCENNNDGETDNRSWNCGHEGPTDDAYICDLRERQKRNFIAVLALSQGVPMLLGGDELGRTQSGNNNCYCQDNEVSWFDWERREENRSFLEFTRRVMELRKRHPTFRRRDWLEGKARWGPAPSGITWFDAGGEELTTEQSDNGGVRAMGAFLNGNDIATSDLRGKRTNDQSFMILFNAHDDETVFKLPAGTWGDAWAKVIDTARPDLQEGAITFKSGAAMRLASRSLVVLAR